MFSSAIYPATKPAESADYPCRGHARINPREGSDQRTVTESIRRDPLATPNPPIRRQRPRGEGSSGDSSSVHDNLDSDLVELRDAVVIVLLATFRLHRSACVDLDIVTIVPTNR